MPIKTHNLFLMPGHWVFEKVACFICLLAIINYYFAIVFVWGFPATHPLNESHIFGKLTLTYCIGQDCGCINTYLQMTGEQSNSQALGVRNTDGVISN